MLLDLRSLEESAVANSGSARFGVTQAAGIGSVHQSTGTGDATYGETTPTGDGTVVNPAVTAQGNGGVFYKPRPKPAPFQLPVPQAPTQRVGGVGQATFEALRVHGEGTVERYVITAVGGARYSRVRASGGGAHTRRRVGGSGAVVLQMEQPSHEGIYDRSLWNQIEDEDKWLAEVISAFGVAA